jgi:hypothetical protein
MLAIDFVLRGTRIRTNRSSVSASNLGSVQRRLWYRNPYLRLERSLRDRDETDQKHIVHAHGTSSDSPAIIDGLVWNSSLQCAREQPLRTSQHTVNVRPSWSSIDQLSLQLHERVCYEVSAYGTWSSPGCESSGLQSERYTAIDGR